MTIRASQLLEAEVVDRQGQRLGKVSDLLIEDPGPANICYALVEIEPPPASGERTVAVPWSVLRPGGHEHQLRLDVSRAALGRLKDLGRPWR
jgi:sporulation protein YlmC with PRC-barrel domain